MNVGDDVRVVPELRHFCTALGADELAIGVVVDVVGDVVSAAFAVEHTGDKRAIVVATHEAFRKVVYS